VPYLDRIPAGVLEMVRAMGATVTSSGELVSRFYAIWSADNIATHDGAAEQIAKIGQDALRRAGDAAKSDRPLSEYQLMMWIREQFSAAGLFTDHGPNVSAGANAANPHYEPSAEASRVIGATGSEILLIDLWAKDMPIEDMKRFHVECLGGIAQCILTSTQDEFMCSEINALCDRLVKHLKG